MFTILVPYIFTTSDSSTTAFFSPKRVKSPTVNEGKYINTLFLKIPSPIISESFCAANRLDRIVSSLASACKRSQSANDGDSLAKASSTDRCSIFSPVQGIRRVRAHKTTVLSHKLHCSKIVVTLPN